MKPIIKEKTDYQRFIIQQLKSSGYREVPANTFDQQYAIFPQLLMEFLQTTQEDKINKLLKIYGAKTTPTILSFINNEECKKQGSRLDVLKHGIDIANIHLDLMYTKPATRYNQQLFHQYERNIFSVSEEVFSKSDERVDLVISLNGLPIMAFELKSNMSGQSYRDAIKQYRETRDAKCRLFKWKSGVLVSFAMDLEECHMTTKLDGESTIFLPFNMGFGSGIDTGAGNPIFEDKLSVSYMWEDILQKDSILEIIANFIFIERNEVIDDITGKKKIKETVIFPRYHQLDVVRKLLSDVYKNGTNLNYLLQHSAGSGKTNEIAWLAHRLASFHNSEDSIIFDNIVICTDRVVVDRQLQNAVRAIEHADGLIKVMDDSCTSQDLAKALSSNTKITITTIQKFPYISDVVRGLKKKTFAVIIDEAHSSTAGKNMIALTETLSTDDEEEDDIQEQISKEIKQHGKQPNVSFFAFTATPKATTLGLFGCLDETGQNKPFHIYSMKQAIEEGFIVDVLQNYTTYKTLYKLEQYGLDPELKDRKAKREIARFVDLDDTNLMQKIEIIVEHFKHRILSRPEFSLGGQAKAMVVTGSRAEAVKCYYLLTEYVKRNNYSDIHALIAFSGKVNVEINGTTALYSEVGINGVLEKDLPKVFDKQDYQLLLVADKYQTGFDQKKLVAMYVLKKLHDVAAVQTLSRLNRIYEGFNKTTFILDFKNEYEDITKAFSRYYTATILSSSVTPKTVYDLLTKLESYYFLDYYDIDRFVELLYSGDQSFKIKQQLRFIIQKTKRTIESNRTEEQVNEIVLQIRHFIRCYEFILQASSLEDIELHKKYVFLTHLQAYLKLNSSGLGYDIGKLLKVYNVEQKKTGEHDKKPLTPDPVISLPTSSITLKEDKIKKLSEIIQEILLKYGLNLNSQVVLNSLFQIVEILKQSENLKIKAKNNTLQDFEKSYNLCIDDALIAGLEQNKELFSKMLNDEEAKSELLGFFCSEVYRTLREEE